MKKLFPILYLLALTSCMLAPRPTETSRKTSPVLSDMENLEQLLLNDQEPIYENRRSTASVSSLRIGMGKGNVQRSLGEPDQVEVAGQPKYGNERWTYQHRVPTLNGYFNETKVIYFEGGRVVGWEVQ